MDLNLTAKQKRFCEEYLIDFNGTQAAIRSGYSVRSAAVIAAENLTKPNIKEEIERKMKDLTLTAEQTSKLMSDIARSSLNDYLTVRKVERSKKVKKGVFELIQELKEKISSEQEYAKRVELDEDELKAHTKHINYMRKQMVRYEIELERNKDAYRIVVGESELEDSIEIDFVKLAQDKVNGKIKSLTWGEFGPKVELYNAETMITNLAKMHNLFTDRLQLLNKNGEPIDPDPLAPVALTVNVIKRDADIQPATESSPIQQEATDA